MTSIPTKPTVRDAWAEAAGPADIVDPGNTFVASGWPLSSTPPARQYFNWILNYAMNGIRYLCKRGIASWDSTETYSIGDVTIAPNGVVSQSLVNNNINVNPVTSFGPGHNWDRLANYTLTADLAPYVLTSTLNTDLLAYVTNTSLASTLASYVTNTSLASTLSAYTSLAVLAANLANYTTTTALNALLALKAPILSPALTGNPTSPTAVAGNNSTAIATTQFVQTSIASKANLASPAFTGAPSAPTPAVGDSTTKLATTQFVKDVVNAQIIKTGISFGQSGSPGARITFPVAFPTSCVVTACAFGQNATVTVLAEDRTGFNLINGANGQCTWIAVGS